MSTLKDRIESYKQAANYKLLGRLPLVIVVNGRSFSKLTSLMDKPFSTQIAECMCATLLRLTQEVDGAVFGYSFNDEIVLITRNDQNLDTNPWYDNDIQKIASVVSSISTLHFNNHANALDLNLIGEPVFTTNVFAVPNVMEAINVMVSKQQQAFQSSIHFACLYELLKKYDKNEIKDMLAGTGQDEKIQLLLQECDVDFNEYPSIFRRGVACYRTPKVFHVDNTDVIKNKWTLNTELPIFTREHSFLNQIFKTGVDIVRKENL